MKRIGKLENFILRLRKDFQFIVTVWLAELRPNSLEVEVNLLVSVSAVVGEIMPQPEGMGKKRRLQNTEHRKQMTVLHQVPLSEICNLCSAI